MKKQYDFSKMNWKPNPYVELLKKPITVRVDQDVIQYFKQLAKSEGAPYQTLMNLFLRFCAENKLRPKTAWTKR